MNDEKFVVMSTKVSASAAVIWDAICQSLNTDTYHLLQMFIHTMIRACSDHHALTPEIQKILATMESDAGWQEAFNIANPGDLKVAQLILILEQAERKGFGAVMIDKPFMDNATQTECVDEILERVCEVTMKGIYRRLRTMGAEMQCNTLSDILLTMIDAQTTLELEEKFKAEMPCYDNRTDNGKAIAYGKKTKAKQHRTVDGEAQRQQRIKFSADDVPDLPECKEKEPDDFRPLGYEW